ncbi:MAG TPA: adenylate/guanylate cyclase domain-containing protein [Desulfobulbaceae bacterium]|nr:adenylate/guanylate cyclase domain-containing protein [Desulfobulbaceae bacterium]
MTTKQQQRMSFYRKIRISLGLMGILPFLLVMYLFIQEQISFSNTIILCAAMILFSILVGFTLLRQSADQLSMLARETTLPEKIETIQPIHLHIDGELENIATNFNAVVKQLNQARHDIQEQSIQLLQYAEDLAGSYEQLKHEEQLRNHLSRYIGNDLVDQIMHSSKEVLLKNQRKTLTVMFADIRSFTALSEQMQPEEVVTMLNEYFTIMVEIVFSCNGMLDKFVGDQLMAVFGHMSGDAEGAKNGVLAALKMQQATEALMQKRAGNHQPTFQIGIGINTGSAIIGNVGSENRMDYTVIGDTVNAAARLEEQAKAGEIIIGEQTYKHMPRTIQVKNRIELPVKNRLQPVACYTIKRKTIVTEPKRDKPSAQHSSSLHGTTHQSVIIAPA